MATVEAPSIETAGVPTGSVRVSETPGTTPKWQRSGKKKLWNSFMKFVRRVHLYSGIFMLPFVLLYGVSGWFFNHPRHLSGDQVVKFNGDEFVGGSLSKLTTSAVMAQQVVDELNKQTGGSNGPTIELTDTRTPQYSGFMSFSLRGDDVTHSVSLDPVTGSGEIRSTFKNKDEAGTAGERNPLSKVRRVQIESNALSEAKEIIPDLIDRLELPPGELSPSRRGSSLMFSAAVDGVPTVVSYNLGSGALSALREDAKPEMEVKSFLQRMHLSRTYSPHFNTRFFWAVIVDGMVISMVFWGLSGLIMWWQIKRTRILGGGFLIGSIICTTWLTVGMHDGLTTSSGLRQRRQREEPAAKKDDSKTSTPDAGKTNTNRQRERRQPEGKQSRD